MNHTYRELCYGKAVQLPPKEDAIPKACNAWTYLYLGLLQLAHNIGTKEGKLTPDLAMARTTGIVATRLGP